MSWVRIWIHLVFTTYKSTPFFNKTDIRNQVFSHIHENAQTKNICWILSAGTHNTCIALYHLGKTKQFLVLSS